MTDLSFWDAGCGIAPAEDDGSEVLPELTGEDFSVIGDGVGAGLAREVASETVGVVGEVDDCLWTWASSSKGWRGLERRRSFWRRFWNQIWQRVRLQWLLAEETAYLNLFLVEVNLRDDQSSLSLVGLRVGEIRGLKDRLVLGTVGLLAH